MAITTLAQLESFVNSHDLGHNDANVRAIALDGSAFLIRGTYLDLGCGRECIEETWVKSSEDSLRAYLGY